MDIFFSKSNPSSLAATIALLLVCIITFGLILSRSRGRRRSRTRNRYPPVAGTVFHQLYNVRRLHDYHTDLSRKHKTFRLLAPFRHQIYTTDPAVVEHILKANFSNYGKGEFNYVTTKDLFGDGIFAVDGDKWRQQRKLASFEFSTRVLRDSSGAIFIKNAAKLAHLISKNVESNNTMDIQDLFMKSTMDSIFRIGFGMELDCLHGSHDGSIFAKAFDDASEFIVLRYVNVFWKIQKFLNVGPEAILRKRIKEVDDFVYKLIHARVDEILKRGSDSVERDDILSRFVDETRKISEEINYQYLRDIILNFVIAGKDTTAGTLSWFLYMICKNPQVQDNIFQEVKEATRASEDATIDEFSRSLTDEALNKMQYLHATLTEALRLYPAVPLDNKVCFSDDVLPNGFNVRKGDIVFYQPYAMGRMEYLWGQDAEIFRPERWLNENGIFEPGSPFKFTAFQAGPRICLGKEFAYRQMKIFAAVLLRFFVFKLRDEEAVVNYRTTITLHIENGLLLYAIPR
ncbi:cytochrome P450 704C1-like isoform X1 [Typha angustifolia]|uniref:cytochrome P450 704C1-like isoform X1 n=1 Tax=Typha angustifolia TaxID=59011 RepID=UPI003C301733